MALVSFPLVFELSANPAGLWRMLINSFMVASYWFCSLVLLPLRRDCVWIWQSSILRAFCVSLLLRFQPFNILSVQSRDLCYVIAFTNIFW